MQGGVHLRFKRRREDVVESLVCGERHVGMAMGRSSGRRTHSVLMRLGVDWRDARLALRNHHKGEGGKRSW